MNNNEPETRSQPLTVGGWIALAVLAGFLAWAGWYAVHTWMALSGVGISPLGWIFLALGVFFTIVVGAGLMALLFYSSRKNYDR